MNQSKEILGYLEKGNKITAIDALNKFSCLRLASRINDLKNEGHEIKSKLIHKNKKKWSEYWIEQSKQLILF